MSVEARINAAFNSISYKPDPNGQYTKEVDIPGSGLTIDEVKEHELVEDAFVKDDGTFHVYVSADSEQRVFTT